jgi:hypothetical protein
MRNFKMKALKKNITVATLTRKHGFRRDPECDDPFVYLNRGQALSGTTPLDSAPGDNGGR